MTFSNFWQADSRPTFHEWSRDLKASGYHQRDNTLAPLPFAASTLAPEAQSHDNQSFGGVFSVHHHEVENA